MIKLDIPRAQQIAYILAALPPAIAARLLESLSPKETAQIKVWVDQITEVSPESVRICLEEFLTTMEKMR